MGKVIPGHGSAEFEVKYSAILYMPFRNEVVDAVVSTVTTLGILAQAGPFDIFISQRFIPTSMKFDPHSNPPSYHSEDQKIEKGVM
ncbi:DNA-directed RNA polymerase II subunit, partial [Coemansia sp. RSA 2424]